MRRRQAEEREILPDPKFNNLTVAKFINILMERGKKTIAEKIVYKAFDILCEKTGKKEPLEIFNKAIDNVRPILEVRPRRVGGATYQIPIEVKQQKGQTIAMRWLRSFAKTKRGKPMEERLAQEILDAYKGQGDAIKKRDDMHKMAEANKAFAHFRW